MRIIEPLLIGNYQIIQDDALYRFTSDSVLLSRFLKARKGEKVADFCSGSGIVGLHFYAENTLVQSVKLFEMQPSLADMSRETVALNRLESVFTVENVRIQEIPPQYTEAFTLILCNPPYGHGGVSSPDRDRALCKEEETLTLYELCRAAARALQYGGRFAFLCRADRLPEAFVSLKECNLEPKKLQLVAGRRGAKPYLALISAVKGGKRGLEVLSEAVNGEV